MKGRPRRLFVALYPPAESRQQMLDAFSSHASALNAKYRPLDHLHMTLQFIGDTDERDLTDVTESVTRSAAGIARFPLTPIKLITLPERGPPRLIAMETSDAPQLTEIHHRLAMRLARNPRPKSADRFLPHFTLCRFSETRASRLDHPVSLPPFDVRAIHLMQSILKPQGATHIPITEVPLD